MNDIVIPKKEFIKEHQHLIDLLNRYDIPSLKKEAKSQKKEMAKMRGGDDILQDEDEYDEEEIAQQKMRDIRKEKFIRLIQPVIGYFYSENNRLPTTLQDRREIYRIIASELSEEESDNWRRNTGELIPQAVKDQFVIDINSFKHLDDIKNVVDNVNDEIRRRNELEQQRVNNLSGGISARDFVAMNRALKRQEAVAPKYEYKEPEFRKTATGAKGFFDTFGQVLKPISQGVKAVGDITGIQPISKLGEVGTTTADASSKIGSIVGSGATHRQEVLKRLKMKDEPHSIEDLSKASGVPVKILTEVYKRGVGAYRTQPKSVRLKGSFVKNVDAPMSKKLSKEQWGMARVYSFLNGNQSHDNDLRKNEDEIGGSKSSGFIQRLMWENKNLNRGKYDGKNVGLSPASQMNAPATFNYKSIANKRQKGTSKSEYGASPFIQKHFGNIDVSDKEKELQLSLQKRRIKEEGYYRPSMKTRLARNKRLDKRDAERRKESREREMMGAEDIDAKPVVQEKPQEKPKRKRPTVIQPQEEVVVEETAVGDKFKKGVKPSIKDESEFIIYLKEQNPSLTTRGIVQKASDDYGYFLSQPTVARRLKAFREGKIDKMGKKIK